MLRQHWTVVVRIAGFNSASYLLTLAALRTEQTIYVIALRQLSIVFGAALGAHILKEAISRTRAAGIALILGGCVLLAWLG
jgi:uncharacterized membrane protein